QAQGRMFGPQVRRSVAFPVEGGVVGPHLGDVPGLTAEPSPEIGQDAACVGGGEGELLPPVCSSLLSGWGHVSSLLGPAPGAARPVGSGSCTKRHGSTCARWLHRAHGCRPCVLRTPGPEPRREGAGRARR